MTTLTTQELNALLALNSLFAVGAILFFSALVYDWFCRRSNSQQT
jgi:hypothetical protein